MSRDQNSSGDPDYYSARASDERRLAMAAADPGVRAIHLELADRYAAMAKAHGIPQSSVSIKQQRTG